MSAKQLTEATRIEWEAFCRTDYAEFKQKNPPPQLHMYLSASAYFDSYDDWRRLYSAHITEKGDAFWKEYGHCVVDWNVPANQRITIRPIN